MPPPQVGRHLIYGIVSDAEHVLRYIGKTHKRRELRLAEHVQRSADGGTSAFHRWLRTIEIPRIFVLERVSPNGDWEEAERRHIHFWATVGPEFFPMLLPPMTRLSSPTLLRGVALMNQRSLP